MLSTMNVLYIDYYQKSTFFAVFLKYYSKEPNHRKEIIPLIEHKTLYQSMDRYITLNSFSAILFGYLADSL